MTHAVLRRTLGALVMLVAALGTAGCSEGKAPLGPASTPQVTIQMAPQPVGDAALTATPADVASSRPTASATGMATDAKKTVTAAKSSAEQAGADVEALLRDHCWVAFAPTHQDPTKGISPSTADLRQDLIALRDAGFDGLITYSADSRTHRLAAIHGFRAMLVGVWDPTSEEELRLAEEAAKTPIVKGYLVGNEGLDKRYTRAELAPAMDRLRKATGLPVSTTEELGDYGDPEVMALGDFLAPNVHPYWAGQREPARAVAWTAAQYESFEERAAGKPLILKETGLPTGGSASATEARQAEFYRLLGQTGVVAAYFEAFDQVWKGRETPVEGTWGLFRSDRSAKPVVQYVCPARK